MDTNCPDGMDCPWWCHCHDEKDPGDICPLLDKERDFDTDLYKLLTRW